MTIRENDHEGKSIRNHDQEVVFPLGTKTRRDYDIWEHDKY